MRHNDKRPRINDLKNNAIYALQIRCTYVKLMYLNASNEVTQSFSIVEKNVNQCGILPDGKPFFGFFKAIQTHPYNYVAILLTDDARNYLFDVLGDNPLTRTGVAYIKPNSATFVSVTDKVLANNRKITSQNYIPGNDEPNTNTTRTSAPKKLLFPALAFAAYTFFK